VNRSQPGDPLKTWGPPGERYKVRGGGKDEEGEREGENMRGGREEKGRGRGEKEEMEGEGERAEGGGE